MAETGFRGQKAEFWKQKSLGDKCDFLKQIFKNKDFL